MTHWAQMTGDSENSLYSVCFKPVHLLPVASLLLSLCLCFCLCVRACVLSLFPSSLSLPSTSQCILIFLFGIHFFLLSPTFSSCITLSFCTATPVLCLLYSISISYSFSLYFSLLLSPFVFRSPSCSFSIGSPSSPSLLSFSLPLFILTLPSTLYKLD